MKHTKTMLIKLIRFVVEVRVTAQDFRAYNLNEPFVRSIYSMKDIERVYDKSYSLLRRSHSCFIPNCRIHDKAKEFTINYLDKSYETNFQ